MPRHPPNAHNNEHTQTIKQTQSRHMRHTTARHHPHTPTQPRKEKTGKEGQDGTTGGGPRTTKHQHRNPSNPTTRVRRSFTYYRCSRPLCSSQPTRPHPPHNSLRKGCSAQGAPPQNPTACHAPTTTIAGRGRGAARPAGAGTPARPAPPRHPVFAAQQIRNPLERR